MRLFRRRPRDAVDMWRAELDQAHAAEPPRWTTEHYHAPDLDPTDVPPAARVGFDGQPLPNTKGALTGLDGGGAGGPDYSGG
jgi:hypothetical protein